MSISSVGGRPPSLQDTLSTSLQSKGLSAEKSSSISSELESVAKATMGAGSMPADPASVREALEQQLTKDVAAGTLTQEEADQVSAALDEFETQMAANRPSAPPPGPPPSGAGGPPPSGGSQETSETEEEDETEKTALEELLEKLQQANQGNDTSKAKDYLTQLMSSGLVDIKA